MADLVYFSEARIQLAREVSNHPDLQEKLVELDVNDFETQLAEIAAHCGVMVNGDYMPFEIDRLCDILITKLKAKHSGIIL